MDTIPTKNFLRLEKDRVCCRVGLSVTAVLSQVMETKISRTHIHKSFIFQEVSILHYCISGLQETKYCVLNPLQRSDSKGNRDRPLLLWMVAVEVSEVTSKDPSPAGA